MNRPVTLLSATALVALASLVAAAAACGTDGATGPNPSPGDADGSPVDGSPIDDGGADGPPDQEITDGAIGDVVEAAAPATGFELESPEIDVAPGQETITCWYFRTSNTDDVIVRTWTSTLTPGVAHMALLFTESDRMPPGTVSATDCVMVAGDSNPPSWAYSTWKAADTWSFPSDDGAGKPVGKPVKAQQSGYLLMHVVNAGGSPIKVRGSVAGIGYAPGTAVTQAEPYVTYNAAIDIPAAGTRTETSTCAIPAGAKLNWMSVLSRRLSTHTYVKDGTTVLFQSTSWEDPGARVHEQAPFATFTTNQATVECAFDNPTAVPVSVGHTPSSETCMMLAYHFPATKPRLCVNDVLLR
jgi:hypothetical protein